VITLPETLPVTEALELLDGLRATTMPIGGVILNRLPRDPFTDAERTFLTEFLEQHHVFGKEGFVRMKESHRALERLRAAIEVPLLTLPEAEHAAPELVELLADTLTASGHPALAGGGA
jgi:hypothetical protein